MSDNQHLLKAYSDRSYLHTTTVRHQGTTVAFAMDEDRRIVYSVLDLSRHDETKGELDTTYWSENPVLLRFPSEVAEVGYAVAGAVALPVVKRGGRIEAATGDRRAAGGGGDRRLPVVHGPVDGRCSVPGGLRRHPPGGAAPVRRRRTPRRRPRADRRRLLR
ncbi:hypothetical protein [Streptomyces sp. LS1784]|uniref:hypothetical protein n=1 Tax=Streptomyces sp. LS1784 TaxID=2851533 RepID=UPI001CCB722D|nr:hypothetical protein [Streptomyces sp. LS1784]